MSEKEKFKCYAAAYLVLVKGGQVLLLRRYQTGYADGMYSLIAGHLDGGETAKQCIIREAAEEAGIAVREEDLEVVHVMHRRSPPREYFDMYLRAEKWTGEIANKEPHKCDDLSWHALDDLPASLLPDVKSALEHIQKQIPYSEFGWAV